MLQRIREKFAGWVAITILAVIGVTFIFFGKSYVGYVGDNYAAQVGDAEIGLNQFEAAYREQLQQNPQFAQLPDDVRLQLRRNVLEQLIQQQVIDNYLADAGYQISDQQILALIHQTPEFQVDGKFDKETYRNLLAQNGYVPADFERAQRTTLRRGQLQRAIRGSAVLTPAAYRRYLNLAAEQRIVTLATIDPVAVAADVNVTDEMIAAYYEDNPTLFQLPESADVDYVEIQRSDVARSITVTEDELAEYYEFNKDRYQQDEQREARHILVLFNDDEEAARKKADELLARAKAGESFTDLARQYSEDSATAEQGGDLGLRARSQLSGDLSSTIFSMHEGEITGPIKSDFGFHIVRLDRIVKPGPLPLEQVRAELTTELQDQKADSLFHDLETRLSNALFEATSIQQLADAVGIDVKSAKGFTRQGGEPLGDAPAIIDAIFDESVLSGEQLSDFVEIDANHAAVFAVTKHNPATRRPLDEVVEQVKEALVAEQAEKIMAEKADQMIAAVENGTEFAAAAAAIGASAAEPVLMSRNDQDADPSVAVAVFTAVKPTQEKPTIGSTRNSASGYMVYSVDAVIPGRPEAVPVDQRDAGKLQLTDQTGIHEFIAFVQALRAASEVAINEDVLAGQDML